MVPDGHRLGYRVKIPSRFGRGRWFLVAAAAIVGVLGVAWAGAGQVDASRLPISQVPSELIERAQLKKTVQRLFNAEAFLELDAMAARFRDGQERTPSGVWKLTVYYSAVQDLASGIARNDTPAWRQLLAKTERWRHAFPATPAAYVADATVRKAMAGSLRPRRLIFEASTGAEGRYAAALQDAAAVLDANKAVASADPQFYAVRADLASALGEAPGAFMDFVNEGLDKHPGYYPLYFSGFDYFLAPGALGADGARRMEAFTNTAVRHLPGTEGRAIYARLYWHAYASIYGNDLFRKSRADWTRMRSGLQAVLAEYPDAWNRQNFSYLACLAGDRDTTGRLLGGVTERPILAVWKSQRIFDGCHSWANSVVETAQQN